MFKETKLVLNNKNLNGKRILLISDIHYYNNKDNKKLDKLLKVINNYNADYICIPGDIIDNNDIKDKTYIINWLKELSKNSIVLLSLGNHDIRLKTKNGYRGYIDTEYINKLNNIDNLYLLNNNCKEFKDIYFYGYSQSFEYYHKNKYESSNIMNNELDKYNVYKDLPNKFNVLLMHSPICLNDKNIKNKLNCYDLILCGHMHNGVVPIIIDDIFKGNRGIIAPNKKLFPKLARGVYRNKNILIISSGITKIARSAGVFLRLFNIFFPIGINVIDFKDKYMITNKYFVK